MKVLKKFWIAFLAAMPISAGAIAPLVIGAIVAGVSIIGVSVWRSFSPVDMQQAFSFFSSCWTCQVFSDLMVTMSTILPGIYNALGRVIIPMSATLLAIFIAWRLFSGFLNNKIEDASKIMGNFSSYIVRLGLLICLLLMPLPRMITSILIEPALSIGTSLNYIVPGDKDSFGECMVATAIMDPMSTSENAANYGAFSPNLRHQLACEVSNIHQVTGLGMTVGWAMLNMAFNYDYMHKILKTIPLFPNVPLFFGGLLILVLYFFALLPIPLYFLEIFIKLSMDLIMLPLMLMAWLFDDENFAIFPKGGQTIRGMIDDVIKGMIGIALTVICLTFSIMFLNAAFGGWSGANVLQTAMVNNDSKFLMDSLMMKNDSLITVILMGIFIAMFMTMIPQLTSMLFKIQISDKYYETAKNDLGILWKGFKKILPGNKNTNKTDASDNSSSGLFGGAGSGQAGKNRKFTNIEYLESNGMQYIDTGVKPGDDTRVHIDVEMGAMRNQNTGSSVFLFGARDGNQQNSFAIEMFEGGNTSHMRSEYGSSSQSLDCGKSLENTKVQVILSGDRGYASVSPAPRETIQLASQTFTTSYSIYLFALNDRGTHRAESECKIYRCSIYENGNVVRQFIPVLDDNGTPCLYDMKEKKFYYNDGMGQFKAGPIV